MQRNEEESYYLLKLKNLLDNGKLSSLEKLVITCRFGLNGSKPYSLYEISRKIKKSKERVRQIQARAIEKLKTDLTKLLPL
jgi:DNA-directed RNA polymerase sigma subunit (sigma70/sigma32)